MHNVNTNIQATMDRENKYEPLTGAGRDFTQLGVVFGKEVENGVVHSRQAVPMLDYILLTDHLTNQRTSNDLHYITSSPLFLNCNVLHLYVNETD